MQRGIRPSLVRITVALAALGLVAAPVPVLTQPAAAATTVTRTFGYTGSVETFTVPDGVASLEVTLTGGQGGLGGHDSQGEPIPGGYRGVVHGTIAVTPGQEIQLGVGGGGGTGVSSRGSAPGGTAGLNPFEGYDGAAGGIAGPLGSSGGGGGSGAASVLRVDGVDLVAGGAGGNGGNGQFLPIVGRRAEDSFLGRPDVVSTDGRPGMNTVDACSPGYRCDGGASGAGGGGAQGGERGDIQYGGASATEYFGFGGYPGSNDTTAWPGLESGYEYYPGNGADGSIVIAYDSGTPGAPSGVTGTPERGAVALTWSAPATSGSAPITDYVVEYATSAAGPYSTFDDGASPDPGATVTGLTNGTTYYFRVAAVNSYGTGPTSTPMTIGITPSDVPAAPTIDELVPFDSGLYVDFTPGHTDSPVLHYEYRLDDGPWLSASAPDDRVTISGLTNGRSYSVALRAVNAIGTGGASAPESAAPRAVASAPSGLAATAGDGTVSLSWSAPASDNGAEVTDYRIEFASSLEGPYAPIVHPASTATTFDVTGLTNGMPTYFRVAAVNAAGVGAFSSAVAATPFTTPSVPAIAAVTPGDGALAVTIAPAFDGGSPLTAYQYRLGGSGAWRTTGTLEDHFTITGLTNGTTYSIELRAVNAAGPSAASGAVSGSPRTVPAPPSIAAVALDTGAVAVSFTAGSDGGSAITNVEYSLDGGATWTARAPASVASPLTISGLVGGTTYPIALRAVNGVGTSAPSNVSDVTVKGTPAAPTISDVSPSDGTLTVSFGTPANGGTPITTYEYSLDGGSTWIPRSPASTASPLVVSGLANGSTYAVRIRAVNAVGSGAASATVSATPRTTPSAPTIDADTIVGSDGVLDVDFTAPASDGGSPITTYQYSTDAGATWRIRAGGSTESPLRITTLSRDGSTPLTGGATYPVEIRAVNAAGAGAASAVANGITTTVPDAPSITAITAYDSSAAVTFTIPPNGGAAITRYEYRVDGGAWTGTGSLAGSFVIGGLANAGTYSVEVRAVNAVGAGPASAARSVDVRTTPGAPTVDAVTSGDRTLTVAFTEGADGGAPITTYEYSTDGGDTWRTRATGTTGSPLVITADSGSGEPLANGTVYTVQLRAVNAAGAGAASTSSLVAPRGAPGALGGVSVTPGDAQLVVSFTPGSDGGSAVTAIEYRLDGGEWVDGGSLTSPLAIVGLTNGTEHTVSVRARNAIGAGEASPPLTGTPRTVPDAPTGVTASVGAASTVVGWTPPADDGGAPVSGYVATLYDQPSGGTVLGSCTTTGATSCTVAGLTNGTTAYVIVTATNAAGTGPASAPRVAVTPLATPRVTITGITTTANALSVDVLTDDGGAPVTTYEYRLDGGAWRSAGTASDPFGIAGLETGRRYTVEVRGVNTVGTGPASEPMDAVPHTTPGAPTGLVATRGAGSVALTWSAPGSDGGQPITDYRVEYATSAAGPFTTFADSTSAATSATVTGLLDGTEYVFRVAAVNSAGAGPVSLPATAIPMDVPGAPVLTTITPGSRYLQVAFTPPSSTGGSAISGYEYQLDGGEWRAASAGTSPVTINGLTNGHSYSVALRAVNAVGAGAASNVVAATPYGLPGAVTGILATPGVGSVDLSWDPVDANGSAITAYTVIRWSARTEGAIAGTFTTTGTSYRVTGLGNGTYWFTVEATNAAGTGPRSTPRTSATVGGTVPAAPTVDAVTVTGDDVTMRWTPGSEGSAAASGYVVQYRDDAGTAGATVAMSSTDGTSAAFTLPSAVAPYTLRVATISAAGVGAFATVRPAVVTSGGVSDVVEDSATVGATVIAGATTTAVEVEYAHDAADLGTGDATVVAASPATTDGPDPVAGTAVLTRLDPGTTYHARPRATAGVAVTYGEPLAFSTRVHLHSTGLDATYSGSPVEITTQTTPSGVHLARTFEGIDGTVYGPSAVAPTDVGTYRVTTTVDDGTLAGEEVATLTITPRAARIGVTAADRSYDGSTTATLTLTLDDVVPGDDVSVDATRITGVFAAPDAGTDLPIIITVAGNPLTGADAASYRAEVETDVEASIEPAVQTLTFTTSAPAEVAVGAEYRPSVSSSLGLPAEVAIADGGTTACSLSGGVVHALAPGTCVVVATQPGTGNVRAAHPVAQSFTVVAFVSPPATRPLGPTFLSAAGLGGAGTDTGARSGGGALLGGAVPPATAADLGEASGPGSPDRTLHDVPVAHRTGSSPWDVLTWLLPLLVVAGGFVVVAARRRRPGRAEPEAS